MACRKYPKSGHQKSPVFVLQSEASDALSAVAEGNILPLCLCCIVIVVWDMVVSDQRRRVADIPVAAVVL